MNAFTKAVTAVIGMISMGGVLGESILDRSFDPIEGWVLAESGGIQSPPDGLWTIGTGWEHEAPARLTHGNPGQKKRVRDWTVLSGSLETTDGVWDIKNQYRKVSDIGF